jgi:hypothetical protein
MLLDSDSLSLLEWCLLMTKEPAVMCRHSSWDRKEHAHACTFHGALLHKQNLAYFQVDLGFHPQHAAATLVAQPE